MLTQDKNYHVDNQQLLRQFMFEKRIIFLEGPIDHAYINDISMPLGWSCSPRGVIDQIIYLSYQSKNPIYLIINSYGGVVDITLSLHDFMKMSQAPIYTVGTGIVASAAALLLSAGTQGKRYVMPNAKTMIHLPEAVFQGNVKDHKIWEKEFERAKNTYIKLLAKYSNKPETEIESLMDRGDHWMNAEETKNSGLADHVINSLSNILPDSV